MSRQAKHLYEFGPFRLDLAERLLLRDGEPVALAPMAFETLVALVERRGRLVEKGELLNALWPNSFVEEHNLANNISTLRKALGEAKNSAQYIETVPKRGYRFVASVRELPDEVSEVLLERHTISSVIIEEETTAQAGEGAASRKGSSALQPVAFPDEAQSTTRQYARWRAKPLIVASSLLVAISSVVWLYASWHRIEPLPPIKVVPLTSLPGTKTTPDFSPDGSQVAFAWNRTDPPSLEIYVKLVSEGEPRQLTHSGKVNFSPVWSPDAQRIAFVRHSENESAIFIMSAYGEDERKLHSFHQPGERRISWSSDGKYIAFADSDRNRPSRGRVIFLFSLETLEKTVLTGPPADFSDEGPAFSPDARDLAFVRRSSVPVFDLYVIPVSGGEPRRLTFGDDVFWTGPTWTGDGRELVFSSKRAGISSLWRVPVSGGNPQRLEVGGDDSIEPVICWKAHRLAYMNHPLDTNIYRVVLPDAKNPGNPPAPFLASTRRDMFAQMSPDGKRIAFKSDRSGGGDAIWVCDIDGSSCAQIAADVGTQTGAPRWSPDGKRIVYDLVRDGKTSIYMIDLETRGVRGLIADPAEERVPSWSRDGQWVYFGSKRSGSWQIWKALAAGGAPVQVTQQGGFFPFESPDARFVYYTKEGDVAGVWRVPTDGGEEILILDQLKPEMSMNWAVVDDGIYFIANTDGEGAILFFDFGSGRVKEIVKFGKRDHILHDGRLAVSSDRRSFFYTVWEHPGGDIMLVENFR